MNANFTFGRGKHILFSRANENYEKTKTEKKSKRSQSFTIQIIWIAKSIHEKTARNGDKMLIQHKYKDLLHSYDSCSLSLSERKKMAFLSTIHINCLVLHSQ